MAIDPRTPVIVGAGQVTNRPDPTDADPGASDPAARPEPVELMIRAVLAAAEDCGGGQGSPGAAGHRLMTRAQSLRVLNPLSWPYVNPGQLVAEALAVEPAELLLATTGGNNAQKLVNATSLAIGRGELDVAIISYVKKEYSLMLGERTAEEIKMTIGSAFPAPDEPHAEIRGRDLVSGLPKTIVVSAEEIRKAVEEPVSAIVDAVKTTLDKCPPELSGDIMDRGIVLTGGGALLTGLDERLRHETGMPIHITDNPLHSVAMGSGKCVEEFEALQQVLISEPKH